MKYDLSPEQRRDIEAIRKASDLRATEGDSFGDFRIIDELSYSPKLSDEEQAALRRYAGRLFWTGYSAGLARVTKGVSEQQLLFEAVTGGALVVNPRENNSNLEGKV